MTQTTTVLIIDDDGSIRESLRLLLEDVGYRVRESADGVSGLDMLRAAPEALVVLLDHFMPRMNAEQFLGIVAAEGPILRRHAYIEMTASPNRLAAQFRALLAELGVPVLAKPFEVEALLELVAAQAQRLIQSG